MLQAKEIHKSYGKLEILRGVNLNVEQGEIVAIVGASGAGKSTFLHIIGTLDQADSGELTIKGTRINSLSKKQISSFRNEHIGFIFQFHHLLPEFTALENICFPAYIANKGRKETERLAMELLEILGLENRSNHKPAELSGGEQQRIAVARALINQPSIILADEPSGNLDSANAQSMHNLFVELRDKFNQTFIIVTHNEGMAEIANRKILMKDGNII